MHTHKAASSSSPQPPPLLCLLCARRVLRPGGVLMVVTYGEPCSRLPLLLQPCYGWHVELYVMGSQLQQHLKSFPTQLSPIIHGPIDAHMLVSEPSDTNELVIGLETGCAPVV